MEIGLIVGLGDDGPEGFEQLSELGMNNCQLANWNPDRLTEDRAGRVRDAMAERGVTVSSFWAGYSGPVVWNFLDGPSTIGLVPDAHRSQRAEQLKRGADFAHAIGAPSVTTHVGFIPENPHDPTYVELVPVLREVAGYCDSLGLKFCFETGQETPVTLLRTIEDVGTDNLGVNLDPANLILYGKANPVDSLDVFGTCVIGLHAKDGLYPTNGRELGRETALGEGKVDFPRLMERLIHEFGFKGPVTIEREIAGPQQKADILSGVRLLRRCLDED